MTPRSSTGDAREGRIQRWAPVIAALVFLVTLNLRPSLTVVGPLLPQIGDDEGLSEGMLGLLGALPLVAFAVVSPLVHQLSTRWGADRAMLAGLLVLAGGIGLRSYTGQVGLWLGTLVIGSAIAVGNVLVPAIVKQDYASNVSRATGIYSACMGVGAAVASAVAVPLAAATDWRGALGFWALPALVVAVLWLPRARSKARVVESEPSHGRPPVSVWRQPMAWLLTAFMGLQSTIFYVMVTWLPTIETSAGLSAGEAGLHLFSYQLVGLLAGLAIPRLMRRPDNQVVAAVTSSVPVVIAALGLVFVPDLARRWVVVGGFGSGSSLVVALSLISLRGRNHQETTQLSGMTQSLGYLFAAAGPVVAGYLGQRTGSWQATLILVAALAAAQTAVAIPAGRDRMVRSAMTP